MNEDDHGPAVRARGLTKSFGGTRGIPSVPVLRGVDLDVPAGAMVSIVGPSGCGKSTLLFCLAGLDRPDSGDVDVLGRSLGTMREAALATLYRDRIGFVFQTSNLVTALSAQENVVLPARLARRRADLPRARRLLGDLGLAGHEATAVPRLSTGEQQRVALARVLAAEADLVFADEPTGALDSATSRLVLSRLRAYPRGRRSVVMVTHDLAAACLADLVLVMRDGRIVSRLTGTTPRDLLSHLESV